MRRAVTVYGPAERQLHEGKTSRRQLVRSVHVTPVAVFFTPIVAPPTARRRCRARSR